MRQTRSGSSYKEEILRFIHSKPQSTFADDVIGVTGAVATALQATGLPVSASAVSTAIGTMSKEKRVTIKYGHRSLDNHLVITEVTVHAEPLEGVAVGPSDPVQRMIRTERDDDHRDDEVFKMLRRIVKLMEGQPSISDAEIERFQAHVDHLVDENLTWEALAQEAENGFAVMTDELRQQLAESESRHQIELAELRSHYEDEVHRADGRAAELRERAERYRVKMETARGEAQKMERRIKDFEDAAETSARESERKVADLSSRLARSEDSVTSLRDAEKTLRETFSDEKKFSTSLARIANKREMYLVKDIMFSQAMFILGLVTLFDEILERSDYVKIDNEVCVAMGTRTPLGDRLDLMYAPDVDYDRALQLIAQKNGLSRSGNLTGKRLLPISAKFVSYILGTVSDNVGDLPSH